MREFYAAFEPHGFKWVTFAPAYGLAEATLLVSSNPVNQDPVILPLDANALEQGKVVKALDGAANVRDTVGCGKLVCETQVVIADPDQLTRCADDAVG